MYQIRLSKQSEKDDHVPGKLKVTSVAGETARLLSMPTVLEDRSSVPAPTCL